LVSGGHCQIIIVSSPNNFAVLGGTIDDALGEAFDKVAKMLGFAYPGGPIIEKMAAMGDRNAFHFPRALTGQDNCNFSFSGLKTAVKRTIERIDNINDEVIANICASFQETVSEILQDKISNALVRFVEMYPDCNNVVLAGGVASNLYLRKKLQEVLNIFHMKLVAPPLPLCTDNAAMIAWAAIEKMSCGPVDDLMFDPRPCWPISDIV
jgi:N6-L-threonylcarbamoyladenine synthase